MNKIFISYNHKDEVLVDRIARELNLHFGRNNIFYDKWSIQPGEDFIGKMNEGLEKFETFFFFLSPNSLASDMVKLEWQNALYLAIKKDLKFIPVRIDDCNPPAILSTTNYIDLYGEGIDSAIEKMKKVVESENCYQPLDDVQNLHAKITPLSENNYQVEIYALYFSAPSSTFAIACDDPDNSLGLCLTGAFRVGQDTLTFPNSMQLRCQLITPLGDTVRPNFPLIFDVKTKEPVHEFFVLYLKDAQRCEYSMIPIDLN